MYTCVLLKLSGEQLAGEFDGGIDAKLVTWLATEVKAAMDGGTHIVLMVGGGNYARGSQLAGHGISRVTADTIGMLATMMNAVAVADIFKAAGVPSRALTNIKADQIIDQFTHRRAMSDLAKGRVIIIAGGIGRPYLTTDTAAVSLALELSCDAVLKATKVDGVYSKDPAKFPDAVKFETMNLQAAVEDDAIKVMDKAALGLALEHQLPIVVFDPMQPGTIAAAAAGKPVGTTIS